MIDKSFAYEMSLNRKQGLVKNIIIFKNYYFQNIPLFRIYFKNIVHDIINIFYI